MKIDKSYIFTSIIVLIFFLVSANVYFIKNDKNEKAKPEFQKYNLKINYNLNTNFFEKFSFTAIYHKDNQRSRADNFEILNKIFIIHENILNEKISNSLIKINTNSNFNIQRRNDTFNTQILIKNIASEEIDIIKEKIDKLFVETANQIVIKLTKKLSESELYEKESKEILIKYINNSLNHSKYSVVTQETKIENTKFKNVTFLKINIFAIIVSFMFISFIIGFLEIIKKFKKEKNYNSN